MVVQAGLGINRDPVSKKKKNKQKRVGRVAQVLECQPSKHKVLSSTPSIDKKRKKLLTEHNSYGFAWPLSP
jgi:hypothetical protein